MFEALIGNTPERTRALGILAAILNKHAASVRLWVLWMLLAIVSAFVAFWLVLFHVVDWMAIPSTMILVLAGLLAQPKLSLVGEDSDGVPDA